MVARRVTALMFHASSHLSKLLEVIWTHLDWEPNIVGEPGLKKEITTVSAHQLSQHVLNTPYDPQRAKKATVSHKFQAKSSHLWDYG